MNLAGFSKSALGSVDRPSVTNSSQCDGSIEFIDRVYHSEVADSKRPRSFQLPSQVLSGEALLLTSSTICKMRRMLSLSSFLRSLRKLRVLARL